MLVARNVASIFMMFLPVNNIDSGLEFYIAGSECSLVEANELSLYPMFEILGLLRSKKRNGFFYFFVLREMYSC